MSKRKVDNLPFFHLLGALNAALPVEYAVRAGQSLRPLEFEKFRRFHEEMRQMWLDDGFPDQVIRDDALVDSCWDILQLGYAESRSLNKFYLPGTFSEVNRTIRKVIRKYEWLAEQEIVGFPFSDRHRICDLLNGNDIAKAIMEIQRKKVKIRSISSKAESIPLSDFIRSIRRPIPLHKGAKQRVFLPGEDTDINTHIGVMLDPYMSLEDVDGALREFLFHYVQFREMKNPQARDAVAAKLLTRWGVPSEPHPDAEVKKINELCTALHGFYCWDRKLVHEQTKPHGARARAIEDTRALYAEEHMPSTEVISSHYLYVSKRIKQLCKDELERQTSALK